jgi:hypothetical protein
LALAAGDGRWTAFGHPDDEWFVVNFADKARLDVPFTSDRTVLDRSIARTNVAPEASRT